MKSAGTTITLILAWFAFVALIFFVEEKIATPRVKAGEISSLILYLTNRFEKAVADRSLGSGGFVVVQRGEIVAERGFGTANVETGETVDPHHTLFLMSSLSKAVTAWGIAKLVEEQMVSLDSPAIIYLKRWRFPGSDAYARHVTVRHLLTHTAGFLDGYGHSGFLSERETQTIEETLLGPADTNSGESHPAVLQFEPGTAMAYSSAGYAVLQLLIEDVSGRSFESFMREDILIPLGMKKSGYDLAEIIGQGREADIATQFDLALAPHPNRYYSNMAGVSLRCSLHDIGMLLKSYTSGQEIVGRSLLGEFSTPQPGTNGTWGLGHTLYQANGTGGYIAGHGGGAFPASGAEFRINATTGNGIGMAVSGSRNFVSQLADDWVFWETGTRPFDPRRVLANRGRIGATLMLGGAVLIAVFRRKKKVS